MVQTSIMLEIFTVIIHRFTMIFIMIFYDNDIFNLTNVHVS